VQQHSGDVTFAHVQPVGTVLRRGDEFAAIETIKVDVSLPAPVAGAVAEVNAVLDATPETVNLDPYETGWLAVMDATSWEGERAALLDADGYFAVMKERAESAAAS